MPPKSSDDPVLSAVETLREEFTQFRIDFASWRGGVDQRCEDRGKYLNSISGRVGKLENGRGRALTWVVAIAGAVGGAVAMIFRLVWR